VIPCHERVFAHRYKFGCSCPCTARQKTGHFPFSDLRIRFVLNDCVLVRRAHAVPSRRLEIEGLWPEGGNRSDAAGVGQWHDPGRLYELERGKQARYLRPGDRVEIEIEGIDTLANSIASA